MKLKDLGVSIDGAHRFGDACIAGTGIPTSAVANYFLAGESIETIQQDYPDLTVQQIEQALRFEWKYRRRFKATFKKAERECREIWSKYRRIGDATQQGD